MSNKLEKLKEIVAKQLGIEPDDVKPEANFTKELGADSLDQVELVMAFEEEFEVDIKDNAAAHILTVQNALDYIEGRWDSKS